MAAKKKIKTKLDLKKPTDFLSALLKAAEHHGDKGEPDMEVGDLQEVIWELWDAMPSGCRTEIMASEKWREFISDHDGAEGVS
jgi:hypothetical protein